MLPTPANSCASSDFIMLASVHSGPCGNHALPVCLFTENPNRLVSLWDMQELRGHEIHAATHQLDRVHCHWEALVDKVSDLSLEARQVTAHALRQIKETVMRAGLPTSAEAIDDTAVALLKTYLPDTLVAFSAKDLTGRIEEIHRTICREMKTMVFLFIPADRVGWYKRPTEDWSEVIARWPKTEGDIIESSKCFALDRFAAAIFHILLVAEYGVIQVGDLLNESGDKPGWGCVDRLQRILGKKYQDRTPLQQKHSQFLKECVDMMISVKDSSRHKITHVDNKLDWLDADFSPQIALEVIAATRGFMRRLAKDLPAVP